MRMNYHSSFISAGSHTLRSDQDARRRGAGCMPHSVVQDLTSDPPPSPSILRLPVPVVLLLRPSHLTFPFAFSSHSISRSSSHAFSRLSASTVFKKCSSGVSDFEEWLDSSAGRHSCVIQLRPPLPCFTSLTVCETYIVDWMDEIGVVRVMFPVTQLFHQFGRCVSHLKRYTR